MNAGAPDEARPHLERARGAPPRQPPVSREPRLDAPPASSGRRSRSAHCRRAIALAPNLAAAHHHLANALTEEGDRSGAIASYRRAVELDPADHDAHSNLILVALTDPSYDAASLGAEARAWAKLHAEPLREHQRPHATTTTAIPIADCASATSLRTFAASIPRGSS